jgi:diphthamide biosynthesis methyltransferase
LTEEKVRFYTSLLEDRCVRQLVKNLGERMRESLREKLESLNIRVHGVM